MSYTHKVPSSVNPGLSKVPYSKDWIYQRFSILKTGAGQSCVLRIAYYQAFCFCFKNSFLLFRFIQLHFLQFSSNKYVVVRSMSH